MTQKQNDILLAHQFETIFSGYYSAVKYFALMLLKSEADAEDITQDVFTKLWTQPQIWTDRDSAEISNYIFAMTKHITINFIKHKRIVEEYQESVIEKSLIEELFQTDDTLEPIYYKEAELLVRLVLSRLPERRREIFVLSRFKQSGDCRKTEYFRPYSRASDIPYHARIKKNHFYCIFFPFRVSSSSASSVLFM